MSDNNNINFEGGSASNSSGDLLPGGSAGYPLNPMEGVTGSQEFLTKYTNIALTKDTLQRVDATFKEFNEQPEIDRKSVV